VKLVTDLMGHVSSSCCISSEKHGFHVLSNDASSGSKCCLSRLCSQEWSLCISLLYPPYLLWNVVGSLLLLGIPVLENAVSACKAPFQRYLTDEESRVHRAQDWKAVAEGSMVRDASIWEGICSFLML
jgi:hypothetical protein